MGDSVFGRLKDKLKGRSQPPTETTTSATSSHGLFLLSDNSVNRHDDAQYPVDIIAVHGLHGNAYTTWKHPNGSFWLKDFLPGLLPGCRVYTYGYPSKVFFNSSVSGVRGYARDLLNEVQNLQDQDRQNDHHQELRPIIFVCHSLGGIVFKQALVFAHEEDTRYDALLRSIVGVTFLGTPHRGSDIASIGSIAADIINAFSIIQHLPVRGDLLRHLESNCDHLQILVESSRHRLDKIDLVSFYETEPTPPLPLVTVVNRSSATLGMPREGIFELHATHRDLCRFPSDSDENFRQVSNAIRRIASKAVRMLDCLSADSFKRSLNSIEVSCVRLFEAFNIEDYKLSLPRPAPGTCQWIESHPIFTSWLDASGNTLLWLTGHPGCGKTVLTNALMGHLEVLEASRVPPQRRNVLVYFCDDKIRGQNDTKSILACFIYQILRYHRSLMRHVLKEYEIRGKSMVESFSLLWSIFLRTIKDLRPNPLYIVIDAVDECEEVTCRQLLESINELLSDSASSTGNKDGIKVLITSRPSSLQVYSKVSQIESHISIDEGQVEYEEDLRKFLDMRINEICRIRSYPPEIEKLLSSTLPLKADHTFLWLDMALKSLESSMVSSNKHIQDIISHAKIPSTLEQTYVYLLQDISPSNQENASKLLRLILASAKHLSLDEINLAFTIDHSHRTMDDVLQERQNDMIYFIHRLLGPFARVLEEKVSLVHQSAKDFLLSDRIHDSLPTTLHAINRENAELEMAMSCIRYLMLEDFSKDLFDADNSLTDSTDGSSDGEAAPSINNMLLEGEDDLHLDQLYSGVGDLGAETYQCRESRYKFYGYASSCWMEHLALCEAATPVWVRESAKVLLDTSTSNARNWLDYYTTNLATATDEDLTKLDQLSLAAFFNLSETVGDLLSQGFTQKAKDEALFWASRRGHYHIVTKLLEVGADPNSSGPDLHTALTTATSHSYLDCVKALLADSRTDTNVRAKNGRGALSLACGNGDNEMVKVLLNQGKCNAGQTDNTGATPLFWAANRAIVKTLAKLPEVDINHRDKKGRTALSWAACDGAEEVVRSLLHLPDIDVNIKDDEGLSPLSLAARYGRTAAATMLVKSKRVAKASVDLDRRNAISWACGRGHTDVLDVLLKHDCPGIDDEDVNGWTPLAWAIQNNVPELIETLVSTGSVDVNRQDSGGKTALYWAVDYGHVSVVHALLRKGADPELASNEGQTPAMLAADLGRDDMVAEIAAKGINIGGLKKEE